MSRVLRVCIVLIIQMFMFSLFNLFSQDGWTALHPAAWNGHTTSLELLLDRGANLEAQDNVGLHLIVLSLTYTYCTPLLTF